MSGFTEEDETAYEWALGNPGESGFPPVLNGTLNSLSAEVPTSNSFAALASSEEEEVAPPHHQAPSQPLAGPALLHGLGWRPWGLQAGPLQRPELPARRGPRPCAGAAYPRRLPAGGPPWCQSPSPPYPARLP